MKTNKNPKRVAAGKKHGKRNRQRGNETERAAAILWRRWFPDCHRSFGQARRGYEQPDIIGSGLEEQMYVEVKRVKRRPTTNDIAKWWERLIADHTAHQKIFNDRTHVMPLLMYKQDSTNQHDAHPWFVVMYDIDMDSMCLKHDDRVSAFTSRVEWSELQDVLDEYWAM